MATCQTNVNAENYKCGHPILSNIVFDAAGCLASFACGPSVMRCRFGSPSITILESSPPGLLTLNENTLSVTPRQIKLERRFTFGL
jgi:hypothetical protein